MLPVAWLAVQVHHADDVQRVFVDPINNGIREPLYAHLAGFAVELARLLGPSFEFGDCYLGGSGEPFA
jgi:hypothetical protein